MGTLSSIIGTFRTKSGLAGSLTERQQAGVRTVAYSLVSSPESIPTQESKIQNHTLQEYIELSLMLQYKKVK